MTKKPTTKKPAIKKLEAKPKKSAYVDPRMEAIMATAPKMSETDEKRALELLSESRGRKITLERRTAK